MPKPRRTENKALPARWRFYHGAYRYMVPPGLEHLWNNKKQFTLGKTLAEAHRTWAARSEISDVPVLIGHGLDKYALEKVPDLAPTTQKSYLASIARLKEVFATMRIIDFRAHHAFKYRNERGKVARNSANKDMEVMSAFFSTCFEWGVEGLTVHPMREGKFRKLPTPARERIVEDWEIDEVMNLKPSKYGRSAIPMLQAYVLLKTVSGRRRIEILRLKTTDIIDRGVRWTLAKQKQSGIKYLITKWTPALHAAIDAAIAARPIGKKPSRKHYRKPADISPWVFCKWDGTPYLDNDGTESDAFGSAWGRFVDALLERTKIKERFWDSDLRAYAADKAKSLEHAQRLLAHARGSTTTSKHYRRRPDEVDPAG